MKTLEYIFRLFSGIFGEPKASKAVNLQAYLRSHRRPLISINQSSNKIQIDDIICYYHPPFAKEKALASWERNCFQSLALSFRDQQPLMKEVVNWLKEMGIPNLHQDYNTMQILGHNDFYAKYRGHLAVGEIWNDSWRLFVVVGYEEEACETKMNLVKAANLIKALSKHEKSLSKAQFFILDAFNTMDSPNVLAKVFKEDRSYICCFLENNSSN